MKAKIVVLISMLVAVEGAFAAVVAPPYRDVHAVAVATCVASYLILLGFIIGMAVMDLFRIALKGKYPKGWAELMERFNGEAREKAKLLNLGPPIRDRSVSVEG